MLTSYISAVAQRQKVLDQVKIFHRRCSSSYVGVGVILLDHVMPMGEDPHGSS